MIEWVTNEDTLDYNDIKRIKEASYTTRFGNLQTFTFDYHKGYLEHSYPCGLKKEDFYLYLKE